MTEKELHKLSRQDLLQLLLAQSKEVVRQKSSIEELMTAFNEEKELTERLKAKLNEKDETIEHLKHRLDAKDETMNRMKAEVAEMTEQVKVLRTRLDEKDVALDAARARLDLLNLGGAAAMPAPKMAERTAPSEDAAALNDEDTEERLRYLKNLLAQNEAMAEKLRKEQE